MKRRKLVKIKFNDVYAIFDGVKMLFTLIFPFILHVIQSSMVQDGSRQQGVYVSDYCPKMQHCAEGTHVMCMYYNPNSVYGPLCTYPKNVSMTPELAERLLEVTNTVRGKIARGTEKGLNGQLLPRGYGIFRLSWDKELATFAQVLANTCILKHDLCRATKRFPNPGQAAGKARFTYPDWYMIFSTDKNFTIPGLTDEKLMFSADLALKSWYGHKAFVDNEMIANYPDWLQRRSTRGRLFLEMIYASATHMGCGISAYTEYAFYGNAGTTYNSVQIMCNFSDRPHVGTAVYNTVPPGDADLPISKCGCPAGSEEDSECLCVIKTFNKEPLDVPVNCNDGACDPTVVVLPIFTMEDTPPDRIFNSLNHSMYTTTDIGDSIFGNLRQHNLLRHDDNKYSNGQRRHFNTLPTDNMKVRIRKRNFGKKEIETNPAVDTRYRQSLRMPTKHVQKKSSIFTRASRFSLPTTRNNKEFNGIHPLKRDVVPRKDFSDAKNLVDKYIYGKNSLFKPIVRKSMDYNENDFHNTENGNDHHDIIRPHIGEEDLHVSDHTSLHHTESSLSLVEKNVIHHDDFEKDLPKDPIFNQNEPIQSISGSSDNKLMNLLDTLEREVKHIEIGDKDKELFDERIRKIYGKVVGKPVEGLGTKLAMLESKNQIDDHLEKHNRRTIGHPDISDKHKLHKDKTDQSFELNDDPAAANHHNEHRNTRDRSSYRNNELENNNRNKNGYRHNIIDSHENKYDDFDYRKDPYKREHYGRKSMPRHDNREDHKSSHKNYYPNHEGDPLSTERRKYYQDKLDNIERRLNRMRNHKRRTITDDRHVRAMLPPLVRKSENQIDSFYIPDRARFLHGY